MSTKGKTIRAFKSDPVPQAILKEIMGLALRAPSRGNSQPWDFVIATGSKLEEIKQRFIEKVGQESIPDIARPQEFPEPYSSRRRALSTRPSEAREAGRENVDGRARNYRNY